MRNQTVTLTAAEEETYLSRCARVETAVTLPEILDRTVFGDTFSVMPFLPRGFADLMIADPPYNLDKNFGGSSFRRMTEEDYAAYTERWLTAALPLLGENASVYVCCDWQSSATVWSVLRKYLHIQNRITWEREKGRGARNNWKNSMEDIWFATLSPTYSFHVDRVMMRRRVAAPYRENGQPKDWEKTEEGNFRNTCPSNFWDDLSVPYWSMPENTAHPTQKPEKLMAKLILASSEEGGTVFDPFAGSGTAAVTARKLGRHYLGIEQNPRYCALTEKRLEAAGSDRAIQGYTDGVFWERNTALAQKKACRKSR